MISTIRHSRTQIAAAILAGGKASRYGGRPKGLLEVCPDRCILQVEVAEVEAAGIPDVVLVGGAKETYAPLGLETIPDLREGIGPLAGLEAGLAHYAPGHTGTLFLPCDLPAITAREIKRLMEAFVGTSAPVVVAATGDDEWHPLCAVVHSGLLHFIRRAINSGTRSVRKTWEDAGVVTVHFDDPTPFHNVNSPEDLASWYQLQEQAR